MSKTTLGMFSALLLFSLTTAQPSAAQKAEAPLAGADRDLLVSPQTLLLDEFKAKGLVEVTIHADVPFNTVDTKTVELSVELGDVPATSAFPDDRGDLVAKFEWDALAALFQGEEGETLTLILQLRCRLITGEIFEAEDEVRVVF